MGGAHPEHDFPVRNPPPPSERFHPVEAQPIEKKAHATGAFDPTRPRLSHSEFISERLHTGGAAGLDLIRDRDAASV